MARTVIAIVGKNQNGILDCQSRRFSALLAPMGLEGHIVQIGMPDGGQTLAGLLQQGDVAFAWGYAGVGSRLALNGHNLWDKLSVPFVSVLADAPFIMPSNHRAETSWVVNAYIYQDWLALQQSLIRSPQLAAMVPMGVIPNEERHRVPWSDRPLRMVFVKTGSDPAALRARWDHWPQRLRPVLHDAADALIARGTGGITDVVLACLAAHDVYLHHHQPLLMGLLHEIDGYVRAARATAMIRALLPLPVHVIGTGWEHVMEEDGRAQFHAPMPAEELDMLYAQSQILVNVTPNIANGAHERVLRGFAAGCRIVSDDNDHARATLHALPSYCGVEWHEPDLADRLAEAFHDPTPYDDRLEDADRYVATHHDPGAFLRGMADLADLARLTPTMAGYRSDAA